MALGCGSLSSNARTPQFMILHKPKIAVCLENDIEANILRVLIGDHKWAVKPKDCAHYSKDFKLEEV